MSKTKKATSKKAVVSKPTKTTTPRKSKAESIKLHLLKKKQITSWEAIMMYKATRLSATIFNLRKKGYNIATIPMTTIDSNGNSVTYAKYKLISEPKGK